MQPTYAAQNYQAINKNSRLFFSCQNANIYLSSDLALTQSDYVGMRWRGAGPWLDVGQVGNIQNTNLIVGIIAQRPWQIIVPTQNEYLNITQIINLVQLVTRRLAELDPE